MKILKTYRTFLLEHFRSSPDHIFVEDFGTETLNCGDSDALSFVWNTETKEFEPELEWESEDYRWVTVTELENIENKHPGLKMLLEDIDTIKIIKEY